MSTVLLFVFMVCGPAVVQADGGRSPTQSGESVPVESQISPQSAQPPRLALQAVDLQNPPVRRRWGLIAQTSAFDMLMPTKWGLSLVYTPDVVRSYEFEYMRGAANLDWLGFDIGGVSEERFTLLTRSFGNRHSFNFSYGLSYIHFAARLGSRYLATVTAESIPQVELFEVSTFGFMWSLGHRWQLANGATFGADWFGIHIPIFELEQNTSYLNRTSDAEARDDIETVHTFIRRFPRFVLLKLQLGYAF